MTLARLIEAVEAGTFDLAMMEDHLPTAGDSAKAWDDFIAAFHGSLDAAKRLHDALLPGWGWEINVLSARLENAQGDVVYGQRIDGPQSRLWLLAILRAMEGRDG